MNAARLSPDLPASATATAEPRHEPLRAGAGLALVRRFHAWRGRSGRRYEVSAYEASAAPDYAGVVALAVRRTPDGRLTMLGAVARDSEDVSLVANPAFARADEIHLHLLAENEAERAKVVRDLAGEAPLR